MKLQLVQLYRVDQPLRYLQTLQMYALTFQALQGMIILNYNEIL